MTESLYSAATVSAVMEIMEAVAPRRLALPGDPVGLLAGNPDTQVHTVLVCLDADMAALAEARRIKTNMIVCHHPRFYRGLSTVADCDPSGRVAAEFVRSGVALFAAHSNLDIAQGGVNDLLADAAGLVDARPVTTDIVERLIKLAVYVPESHVDEVASAICEAGCGQIGEYSECTFRIQGMGTFRCGENTNPHIGKPGSFEKVAEWRLETIFSEFDRARVEKAIKDTHPYEEPAYDLYPLAQSRSYGLGRVGELKRPSSLGALAGKMKKATGSPMAQIMGERGKPVRRVAVWGGSGVAVEHIVGLGVDALVAGEVGHHAMETLFNSGVGVITLGHGPSEWLALPFLAESLREGLGIRVEVSRPTAWIPVNI